MLLIKNGTLVNPKTHMHELFNILIENGKIVEINSDLSQMKTAVNPNEIDKVIDANGLYVVPGFIDLHVHLREPGFENKETIYTGTRACAKGGYTSVFCMPNTKPTIDNVITYEKLNQIIEKDAVISVYPVAAITKGIQGQQSTDHHALFHAGALALSDDGRTTMNENCMIEAFEQSRKWNRPIMTHSEDHEMTIHFKDTIFPEEAESNIVLRDLKLCEQQSGILHVQHVSTKVAIEAIRNAKTKGIKVTCEAAPHHFALSEEIIDMKSTLSKVNPPIRKEVDRQYLLEAIKDGTIDVIATDHAPHEKESKEKVYSEASFGISGIETAFSVSNKTLVETGLISFDKLIQMLTENPAKIAHLDHVGSIELGYDANLVILDPNKEVVIQCEDFLSKGKNTPFNGFAGKGEIIMTIYKGEIVYQK